MRSRDMFGRVSVLTALLLLTACLGSPTNTPIPTASPAATSVPTAVMLPATETPTLAPPKPSPTPAATQLPTPATSNPSVRQALAAMDALHSYHYTETLEVFENGHGIASEGEGDYRAPGGLRWSTLVEGITATAVLTGDQYYVAVGNGEWTQLPGGPRERARQMLWTLLRQAKNVTEIGRDPQTDPDPTAYLTFTLPLNILPLGPHPFDLANGEVWIGQHDGRIHALKLFAQEPYYETTMRFFFSKFNTAPVEIKAPPPTRVPGATPTEGRLGNDAYLHLD